MPVRERICGLSPALSVRVRLPLRMPVAVGVNVTPIAQLLPGASVVPHVVLAGSTAKSPLAIIVVMVKVAVPELVTLTVLAPLDVPRTCLLKVKLVVERLTVWAHAGMMEVIMNSGTSSAGLATIYFGLVICFGCWRLP